MPDPFRTRRSSPTSTATSRTTRTCCRTLRRRIRNSHSRSQASHHLTPRLRLSLLPFLTRLRRRPTTRQPTTEVPLKLPRQRALQPNTIPMQPWVTREGLLLEARESWTIRTGASMAPRGLLQSRRGKTSEHVNLLIPLLQLRDRSSLLEKTH